MSAISKPQIKYCLFDMDGLLIDSEAIYTKVTNDILSPYGKIMTWDIKKELYFAAERAASETLLSYFPDISLTVDDYIAQRRVAQDLAWPTVSLLPGSQRRNYELKTGHLGETFGLFGDAVVCGDDPEVKRGKPAPDVFLVAAKQAGMTEAGLDEGEGVTEQAKKARAQGLVFEDATSGVIAGKRAGMNVVWIPDPNLSALTTSEDLGADETLRSLVDFKPESWGLPPYPATE
ncbi:haloacid dehalogenase [Ceratobasidium sp. AG-Ba]|nr:haloacid dehalogenase [Ceratobasidium sp. AG-Ba]